MQWTLKHIFPKNDPVQALRIRRFLIAAASYLMWLMLIFQCYRMGFVRLTPEWMMIFFSLCIFINMLMFLILRTGLNLRFSDPSLTMLQMILATLGVMITIYFTDYIRGVMLLAYIVTMLFGVFRFKLRQYIKYAGFSIISYTIVVILLLKHHPEQIDVRIEALQWAVFAAVLAWFSIIGSYISNLRQKLSAANHDLKAALHTINELAIHDDLTQAYNRRHMFERLRHEKATADRGGPGFSIAIFDLDHFKAVNDTYGHQKGDEVLKFLIQAVKYEIREVDCVARYGGEEFVIIMGRTAAEGAQECAQRIQKAAAAMKFPGFPPSFGITISIGLTVYQPTESIDQIIARADEALFSAKAAGRNRVVVGNP